MSAITALGERLVASGYDVAIAPAPGVHFVATRGTDRIAAFGTPWVKTDLCEVLGVPFDVFTPEVPHP